MRTPNKASFNSLAVKVLRLCFFLAGRLRDSFCCAASLHLTTSAARAASSCPRCSGVRCPKRRSSFRPEGQEHSINMVDSFSGIFGAARRHTLMVCGFSAIESGSTSPKKRNSRRVGSWRMKKAVEEYWPRVLWPWLMGTD